MDVIQFEQLLGETLGMTDMLQAFHSGWKHIDFVEVCEDGECEGKRYFAAVVTAGECAFGVRVEELGK